MDIEIENTHSVEKPGFFGRALLTYTMSLAVVLSDEELAAIEERNLYEGVLYQPPWHPLWRIPEDEDPPAFCVSHLVAIHEAGTHAAIAYFTNDNDSHLARAKLWQKLEDLKTLLVIHEKIQRGTL